MESSKMMEKHLPFNMEVHCREAQIRNDLIAIRSDLIFYCHTSIRKLPNANQYLMSTISIWSVWFVICPVLYKVILLIRGNNLAYTCGRDVRNQYKSQIRVICHRVLCWKVRNDWKWCDILQKKSYSLFTSGANQGVIFQSSDWWSWPIHFALIGQCLWTILFIKQERLSS